MTKWTIYLLNFLVLLVAVASCQPIRPVAPPSADTQPVATPLASTEITATMPITTAEVITETTAVATAVTTDTVTANTPSTDTVTTTTTSTNTLGAPTLIPTPTSAVAATEPTTQTIEVAASPAAPTATQGVENTTQTTVAPSTQPIGSTDTTAPPAGGATATVAVPSLRIRSGPGVDYEVVGAAQQGNVFVILSQASGCEWLRIQHAQLSDAWVAGGVQFVTTSVDCAQIAEAPIPGLPVAPTPTEVAPAAVEPTPAPTAAPADTTAQPTPTVIAPEPTPTSAPAAADPFPPDKGCYLIQNQLGPELTFTVTSEDGSWNETFKVGPSQELPYCLPPGKYRVTVDAPPPWADLNQDIIVNAGDRFYFPIRAQ